MRSLLVVLLLTSCSGKKPLWETSETKTRHTSHQAFSVSQKPDNIFRGMEIEFVRTSSGLRSYLNVHSLEFKESHVNAKKTEIVIVSQDEERKFLADRLEGGQRLLLSEEAQKFLLDELSRDQTVNVVSGRFDVEISPDEFPQHAAKLRHKFSKDH